MVWVDFEPRICSSGDFCVLRVVWVVPEVFLSSRSYSAWALLSAAASALSMAACCLAN
jgi:hypothetical protein